MPAMIKELQKAWQNVNKRNDPIQVPDSQRRILFVCGGLANREVHNLVRCRDSLRA
jgi:hypothetical protein